MDRNEYIQLQNMEDGLYMILSPAEGKGNSLTFDDIMYYLDKIKVVEPNIVQLKGYIDTARRTGKPVKISEETVMPFSGWCEYIPDKNGMNLIVRMFPPLIGMDDIEEFEIDRDLANLKIKSGIQEENIKNMVENRLYFTSVVGAVGTDPIDGHDAELIYNFNVNLTAKPKMNEDGTVDFHQLDLINHVTKGDVVAEIKPEDPGVPGINIYGIEVKPKKIYRKSFKYSRNLQVSEDGHKLISLVTGHVTLEGDKVFVSDEFEVKTDVDNTTGDIEYDGNVRIRGNVLAGFKINATGNVRVDGVVEGAQITAGGNIVLARGIQGMNKGVLIAGGDIVATFIENAQAKAGGNIDTDAVLHSQVSARGNIEIHGKNGYLIGGNSRAGSTLTAKIIGSTMGTTTVVGVGADPELTMKIEKLKKDIAQSAQEKQKISQIITLLTKKKEIEGKLDKDKSELLQKTMKSMILLESSIKSMRNEYTECLSMVHEVDNARIKITGSIYPGTKLEIGDSSLFIRDKNDFCQYVRQGADIVRINL